jgi:phage tail-like protein
MNYPPYYPPGAFYFSVSTISDGAASLLPSLDASFQEVSGIEAEFETEAVEEGGENRFAYRLPRFVRYPNLVLKRGVVPFGSSLADWLTATLGSGLAVPIVPKDLMVTLLTAIGIPLIAWTFVRAYPVHWQLDSLSSTDNKVLIETLQLNYNYFNRVQVIG